MRNVLFIDDEKRWIWPYIEELKAADFEVRHESNVDSAMRYLDSFRGQISLLILDMMMSPGEHFSLEETSDGMRTGISLYDFIRRRMPDVPVIILTNVSDEGVRRRFEKEEKTYFARKPDYFPNELVCLVKDVLGRA